MRLSFLFLVCCFLTLNPALVMAKPDNPVTRLDVKTEDILKGLDQNQTLQFEKIRTAYGTIRAVNDVKASLERALKSCTTNNPDLQTPMTERVQAWKNAVLPTVRKGENRLEKMILTQSFARPSAVRAYLKSFDDAVKYQDDEVTEIPVSKAADCQALMKNMGESEQVMGKLIIETLGLDRELVTTETPVSKK